MASSIEPKEFSNMGSTLEPSGEASIVCDFVELLETMKEDDRIHIVALREIMRFFRATHGCIALTSRQAQGIGPIVYLPSNNESGQHWDRIVLLNYLQFERPTIPLNTAIAQLRSGNRTLGILAIRRSDEPAYFSSRERKFLRKLAARLASEIHRRRRVAALEVLAKAGRDFTNPGHVYVNTLRALKGLIGWNHSAAVMVLNSERSELVVRREILDPIAEPNAGWTGEDTRSGNSPRKGMRISISPGLVNFLEQLAEPLAPIADEYGEWTVSHPSLGKEIASTFINYETKSSERSMLLVPLRPYTRSDSGKTIGILKLSSIQPHGFLLDKADLSLLQEFAARIFVALDYSNEFERHRRSIEAIVGMERRNGQTDSVVEVCEGILHRALAILNLDMGWIELLDDKGRMQVMATQGCKPNAPYFDRQDCASYEGWRIGKLESGELSVCSCVQCERMALSRLCEPIMHQEELLGFINLASTSLEHIATAQIGVGFVKALAKSAGSEVKLALLSQNLSAQAGARKRYLDAIYEVTSSAIRKLGEEELCHQAVEILTSKLGFRAGFIRLLNKHQELEATAFTVLQEKMPSARHQDPLRLGEGIAGRVAATGQSRYILDVLAEPSFMIPSWARANDVGSLLCIPLQTNGEIMGTLSIYTRGVREFNSEEQNWLETFARQTALAIHHSRMHKSEQRRLLIAETLRGIAARLSALLDPKQVAEAVLDEVTKVIDCDGGSVMLIGADGNFLPIAVRGHDPEHVQAVGMQLTSNVRIQRMMREQEPRYISDVTLDRTWVNRREDSIVRSWVGSPLIVDGSAVGLLNLEKSSAFAFGQEEADLLLTFAHQAALAISNAQAHTELALRVETLDQLRQLSQAVASSMNLKSVLDRVVTIAGRTLKCDCVVIYPFDPQRREFYARESIAAWGLLTSKSYINKPRRESGMAFTVRKEGSLVVSHVAIDRPEMLQNPFIQREEIQAFVGIALNVTEVRDKPIERCMGVLYANYRHPHNFTANELDLIGLLANQAAVAISNARSHFVQEQRVKELQALERLSVLSLDKVLEYILGNAAELVDATHGSIGLVVGESLELRAWLGSGWTKSKRSTRLVLGQGISGRVAKEGKPWLAPNVKADPHYYPLLSKVKSELAIPLLSSRIGDSVPRVLGVLDVGSTEQNHFSHDHLELLEDAVRRATIAIEHAHVKDRLEVLNSMGRTISSSLDSDEVLRHLVQAISTIFRTQDTDKYVNLYLFDHEQNWLSFYRHLRFRPSAKGEEAFVGLAAEEGLAGWAAMRRETVYAPDVSKEPFSDHYVRGIESTRSEVETPIISSTGELLGVLGLESPRMNDFDQQDIDLLETISKQAAVAIQNARSSQRAAEQSAMSVLAVNALVWAHRVAQQAATIRTQLKTLRRRLQPRDDLDASLQSIDRLAASILQVIPNSPIDSLDPGGVSLGEVLHAVAVSNESTLTSSGVVIACDWDQVYALPRVVGNGQWLEAIFENLVNNALREMPSGGRLAIDCSTSDGKVSVEIRDTGSGFPLDMLHPSPTVLVHPPKGRGLGLRLTQMILSTHYFGRLAISNNSDVGGCVQVTLRVRSA